jgi:hypothetical protein
MKAAATSLQILVRILFALQLIVGIAFWTGNALGLIPAHMILGIALVVCLWISAVIAALSRVHAGIIVGGIAWGAVVIALGMAQSELLPGSTHWVIQVLHLLVGFGAIGFNERLNRATLTRAA